MNERTVKYYVGRINEETGEQSLMQHDKFSGIFRATNDMTSNNGYDDARTVNQVSTWLNNIDDAVGGKFYYYRVVGDNSITRAIPEDAPEDVLKWFREKEEEETEEEPTE